MKLPLPSDSLAPLRHGIDYYLNQNIPIHRYLLTQIKLLIGRTLDLVRLYTITWVVCVMNSTSYIYIHAMIYHWHKGCNFQARIVILASHFIKTNHDR